MEQSPVTDTTGNGSGHEAAYWTIDLSEITPQVFGFVSLDGKKPGEYPVTHLNDLTVERVAEAIALHEQILQESGPVDQAGSARKLISILVPGLSEREVRKLTLRQLGRLVGEAWVIAGGPFGIEPEASESPSMTSSPDSPASTPGDRTPFAA